MYVEADMYETTRLPCSTPAADATLDVVTIIIDLAGRLDGTCLVAGDLARGEGLLLDPSVILAESGMARWAADLGGMLLDADTVRLVGRDTSVSRVISFGFPGAMSMGRLVFAGSLRTPAKGTLAPDDLIMLDAEICGQFDRPSRQ